MGRIIRNQQWVREQIAVSSTMPMKKGKACSIMYCQESIKEGGGVDQSMWCLESFAWVLLPGTATDAVWRGSIEQW